MQDVVITLLHPYRQIAAFAGQFAIFPRTELGRTRDRALLETGIDPAVFDESDISASTHAGRPARSRRQARIHGWPAFSVPALNLNQRSWTPRLKALAPGCSAFRCATPRIIIAGGQNP